MGVRASQSKNRQQEQQDGSAKQSRNTFFCFETLGAHVAGLEGMMMITHFNTFITLKDDEQMWAKGSSEALG